jgi:uncharacterized protein
MSTTMSRRSSWFATLTERFSEWVKQAGLLYGGKRDLGVVAGYLPTPKFADYLARYERNGLARRIVELPATTTWREPPEVVEEGQADGTEFTKAVATLAKQLPLFASLQRADTLAGIGRFSVILIGTRGVDDAGLKQQAQRLRSLRDVIYLECFDEAHAQVVEYDRDPGSPRFREPTMYELRFSGPETLGSGTLLAHHSRVLHVVDGTVGSRIYGTPRLQPVLNRLDDLEKVSVSTGESYYQRAAPTWVADLEPSAEFTDEQADTLQEQLGEMVHDQRHIFVGQGVKLSTIANDAPNVESARAFLFAMIAASVGIPQRILFGNESGELASSTDQATYFGMIGERQQQFAEPILRTLLDRLISWQALPVPKTGEYQISWPQLFRLTELETADANLKRAQAAAALTPMGGDPTQLVEIDEDRNIWPVPKKAEQASPPEPPPTPTPPEQTDGG